MAVKRLGVKPWILTSLGTKAWFLLVISEYLMTFGDDEQRCEKGPLCWENKLEIERSQEKHGLAAHTKSVA